MFRFIENGFDQRYRNRNDIDSGHQQAQALQCRGAVFKSVLSLGDRRFKSNETAWNTLKGAHRPGGGVRRVITELPKAAHKDPFDRMLIWQRLQRRWTFITRDGGFDEYRAVGLHTAW